MTTPIRVKVNPDTLSAWRSDEYASFEDHDGDPAHVYAILGREHGHIVCESVDELRRVIKSGEYHGDPRGWNDRYAFRAAVGRIVKRLKAEIQ